jgi:hypothetical protein
VYTSIRRGTKELFRNGSVVLIKKERKKERKRPVFTLLPIGDAGVAGPPTLSTRVDEHEEKGKVGMMMSEHGPDERYFPSFCFHVS